MNGIISSQGPATRVDLRPIAAAVVLVALSFVGTLYALGWLAPTPRKASTSTPSPTLESSFGPPITTGTALADAPKIATPGLGWYAIEALNAQTVPGTPAIKGSPVVRLVAVPQNKRHTIAAHVVGLQKHRLYRIMAWVQPVAGGNLRIEASDHAATDASYAAGAFDLSTHDAGGTGNPGSAPGPGDWQKTWIFLPTSNGELFFNLDLLSGGQVTYKGDGKLGILLGALSLEPQD